MILLRILAYFVPFGINFLTGGFFFITAHRFAGGNCPRIIVASAVAAWGVAYCLTTTLIGRIMKSSNALFLIISGGILLCFSSLGFIVFSGLYTQFLWLILAGIGAALFCAPFQLFAKSLESGSSQAPGTVRATAFYTLTWSLGFASGPLAFARLTNRNGFMVTLFLAMLVTASVVTIALFRKKSTGITEKAEVTGTAPEKIQLFPEKSYTRLAVLGWIVGGLGTLAVCQIRAMWPKLGDELNFSRDHVAYVLALVSCVQGFTALMLCNSKCWMWKRFPAFLMSFSGISGLLIFASARQLPLFYLAAVLFGIYSGCLYFYLVYHSLAHPSRSGFFVSGNEVIVGITSMLAPLAGGFLADIFQFTGAAFLLAVVTTVIALTAQLIVLIPEKLMEGK